jgi:hypothetical protein
MDDRKDKRFSNSTRLAGRGPLVDVTEGGIMERARYSGIPHPVWILSLEAFEIRE